ncbi:hypothetical protein C8236_08340, partial [Paracidovorax avenae]
ESVYAALVTQTRLRPYLDSVELVVDEKGVRFDTSALSSMLDAKKGASERDAIIDLVELNRYQGKVLDAVGVDSLGLLSGWVQVLPADSPVRSELQGLRVFLSSVNAGTQLDDIYLGGASSDHFAGRNGDDRLHGGAGDDVLQGEGGDDRLSGGVGNDNLWGGADNDTLLGEDGNDGLYGEAGDDVLDGGAGNDYMDGGAGANTYRFGRGDGQDTIAYKSGGSDGKLGTLQFKDGVQASDLVLRQVYDNQLGSKALEVSIAGTADKVTINGFFYNSDPANPLNSVQRFEFADGTAWDLGAITAKLFAGTASADDFTGTSGDDTMHGGAGNDELRGGSGNDTLLGEDGNDGLYGEAGDDVMDGGAGNDYMDGGAGANTYRFGRGDGQDTIAYKSGGSDGKLGTLQFKDGVQASDLVLRQVYDNQLGSKALEVSIAGTADKVTINGFFYNSDPANPLNSVQRFEFADGTAWDLAAITAKLFTGGDGNDTIIGTNQADTMRGGRGNDDLWGGAGNDTLLGEEGNDGLYGEAGDDVMDGGAGNDYMDGGAGANTYRFGRGDGQDTIAYKSGGSDGKLGTLQFKDGVQASDLVLRQVYDNQLGSKALEVSIAGTADKVTINGFFYNSDPANPLNSVQRFEFADGTTLDLAAITAKLFTGGDGNDTIIGSNQADTMRGGGGNDDLWGGAGNDTLLGEDGNDGLYGEAGDDVLDGGAGNDYMDGGAGANTYRFGRGDGQDTIAYKNGGSDGQLGTLQFKDGVQASDLVLRQVYDNQLGGKALEVSIAGTGDKVTINGFFYNSDPAAPLSSVQRFEFADGTAWDLAAITAKLFAGTASADDFTGTSGDDTMHGGAGNDELRGGAGNDTLLGEEGNDGLYGEAGDDVMDGGAGNDYMDGGAGANTYRFGRGDGQDTIAYKSGGSDGKLGTLQFKDGVQASDLVLRQVYDNQLGSKALEVSIAGTADKVTINGFFYNSDPANPLNSVQRFEFADGTAWDLAAITAKLFTGGDGNDTIVGTSRSGTIRGEAGDDSLYGGEGNDVILGGSGNDWISGEAGDDVIEGGAGNDNMTGGRHGGYDGAGNDTYVVGRGDGNDIIYDNDGTPGNADVLQFQGDIQADQLWFRRVGQSLEVSVIGSGDKVNVLDWFASANYQLEQIKSSDGKTLSSANVNALVEAMAAFAPPAAGQTTLPPDYRSSLSNVIATNWT